MPTYDEYEDDYLDNASKEPMVYNHRLDHLEEAEGPKWDASSCSWNSECQEEYISSDFLKEEEGSKWDISLCFSNLEITLLDSIKEHNGISFEMLERNHVLNFDILDEEVDISFENHQERSLHGFLEEPFGMVLEKL